MGQGREASAGFGLPIQVNVGHYAAGATGQALQYRAPVIHDEAIAIGFTPIRVKPGLGRRYDIAKILDGTGTQQRLPVCPPGRGGERGGYGDDLRPCGTEAPE